MTGVIHIYYIWYGKWLPHEKSLARDLATNIGTSTWWGVTGTYCDSSGTPVARSVTLAGEIDDPMLSHGMNIDNAAMTSILTAAINAGTLPADPNGFYALLTAPGVQVAPIGSAWHDNWTVQNTNIPYAVVSREIARPGPNGDPQLDGQMSLLAHELAETATDPFGSAWGPDVELGDACETAFTGTHPTSTGGATNVHLGSHDYLLQSLLVNAQGGYCAIDPATPSTYVPPPSNTNVKEPATCTDATDTACGASCSAGCLRGQRCVTTADCQSARFARPVLEPVPFGLGSLCSYGLCGGTCYDGVQDGDETGVDCGGPDCPGCGNGCNDSLVDNQETDLNCGGPDCTPCVVGRTCRVGRDCIGGGCVRGACVTPTCTDGIQDGDETAVDCGGGSCPPCPSGVACVVASDCQSDFCSSLVCLNPPVTCGDGILDGQETAVDCGGPSCPPCDVGQTCQANTDCQSGTCDSISSLCAIPTCTDKVQDGRETGVDCGGGACPACGYWSNCRVPKDCRTGLCSGGQCQAGACQDGVKDGSETDVDCGGAVCNACATGKSCLTSTDCSSHACSAAGICLSHCYNGVRDYNETDVDCGGPICKPCGIGQTCLQNPDCASGLCSTGYPNCGAYPCGPLGQCISQ
jgi:hypothetical protein